jgi:3-phenylpropionate/trans-cinnamate dioxygenase ferredoxin reductase subunit
VVIERERRVLARVACEILSDFFQDFHRAQGVTIELDAQVAALEGDNGTVTGVRLGDGRLIACDAALVGVGAMANDELARQAGLSCDGGVIVDLAARTEDPAVFAIGDCTRRPLPLYGRMMRLESVPNALEQAKQAASAICGKPPPTPEVPWFWSDQYDLKLQIAGLSTGYDEVVIRGDREAERFAALYYRCGNLLACDAVNSPADYLTVRKALAQGATIPADRAEDPATPLKTLITPRAVAA